MGSDIETWEKEMVQLEAGQRHRKILRELTAWLEDTSPEDAALIRCLNYFIELRARVLEQR